VIKSVGPDSGRSSSGWQPAILTVPPNNGPEDLEVHPFLTTLVVAFVVIQIAVFTTTIYLHRSATHRALQLHPVVEWFFKLGLWMTTGLATKEWVAVHRKHHAFTDEEGDPHSPHLEGFWPVQLGNVFYYVREARNPEVVEKYARDIKDGLWDRLLFNTGWLGPVIGTAILCAFIGIGWGLLAAAIHTVMYVFVLSPSINGLCHYAGYRNYDNTATNIRLLALITGGEGLHNNHHGFPRSPKFSVRASEFDPAWVVIKLLTILKLAKPYKTIEEASNAG
jgi:stearoyl-CoA desaturase (delta-9 desaturase)